MLKCPKCDTEGFLRYITHNNTSTENYRTTAYYYQCVKCGGYVKKYTVESIKWTAECPLSETLA